MPSCSHSTTHLKSVTFTSSSCSDLSEAALSFSGLLSLISCEGEAGGGEDIEETDAEEVEPVEALLATTDFSFGASFASLETLPLRSSTRSCFFGTSRTAGVVF